MPWIEAKWDGVCKECERHIEEGDKIFYDGKSVYCEDCGKDYE